MAQVTDIVGAMINKKRLDAVRVHANAYYDRIYAMQEYEDSMTEHMIAKNNVDRALQDLAVAEEYLESSHILSTEMLNLKKKACEETDKFQDLTVNAKIAYDLWGEAILEKKRMTEWTIYLKPVLRDVLQQFLIDAMKDSYTKACDTEQKACDKELDVVKLWDVIDDRDLYVQQRLEHAILLENDAKESLVDYRDKYERTLSMLNDAEVALSNAKKIESEAFEAMEMFNKSLYP